MPKHATHFTHSSNRGKRYEDFFCLTPIGIRVGYGSPKLLAKLSSRERAQLKDRVVWISTSNARDGALIGQKFASHDPYRYGVAWRLKSSA